MTQEKNHILKMQRDFPPPSFLDGKLVQRKIMKWAKLVLTATHHPFPCPPPHFLVLGSPSRTHHSLLLSGCSVLSSLTQSLPIPSLTHLASPNLPQPSTHNKTSPHPHRTAIPSVLICHSPRYSRRGG